MFAFPGSLSISNVNEVRNELLAYLKEKEPENGIVLDLSGLQDLDTAGLQLILSVCMTINAEGRSFLFEDISPFVRQVFQMSGVTDILEKGGLSQT